LLDDGGRGGLCASRWSLNLEASSWRASRSGGQIGDTKEESLVVTGDREEEGGGGGVEGVKIWEERGGGRALGI